MTEVVADRTSLNSGDVFVLDSAAAEVFVFEGAQSNQAERARGLETASWVVNERTRLSGLTPLVVVVQEDAPAASDAAFWKVIGGKGAIAAADDGSDEQSAPVNKRLFRYEIEGFYEGIMRFIGAESAF